VNPYQEDSLLLWKAINASKLLSKTEVVLFLNKCDILTAKLKAGAQFKDYVPVYDGANTMEGVTRCELLVASQLREREREGNGMTDSCYLVSRSPAPQVPCDTEEPFHQSESRMFIRLPTQPPQFYNPIPPKYTKTVS
jgi:G-protein alpha subunit